MSKMSKSNKFNAPKDNVKHQQPSSTSLLAINQPSASSLASLLSCQRNVNRSSTISKNKKQLNNTAVINASLTRKKNTKNNSEQQLSYNYNNYISNNNNNTHSTNIYSDNMTQKFDAITLRLLESLFTINERPCSEAIEMIAQRIKSDFTTVAHWFQVKRNRSQQFQERNQASSLLRINPQTKNKRKEQIYDNNDDDNITTPSNNSINTCNNNKRLNISKNHRTSTESSSADSSTNSNMIFPFDASQLLKHLQQQLLQQQQMQQQQLQQQLLEKNNKSIYDDSYDLDDRLEDDLQPDVPLNDIDYYASSNSAAPSADCEDYDDMDIQDYSFEEIAAVSEMVRHRRMTMGLSQTKASQSFRAFTGGQCEFGDNFIAQFESMQAEQQTAKWALRSFGPWLDYIEGELSLGRELLFMAHDDPTRTARRREGRVFTFSEYQRTILENCFAESQYLTPEQFDELSRTIRVPNRSLKTWFKNRRSKQRSQSKVSETNVVKSCNKFVVH